MANTKAARKKSMPDFGIDGSKHGIDLLHDPSLNKSTGFTEAERKALGLVGLVPDVTESEDLQLRRVMQQLGHTDPAFTLRVYSHMMRRSAEERERLRALVEGRVWAVNGQYAHNSAVPPEVTGDP